MIAIEHKTCTTCEHTHKKNDTYPCVGCDNYSRWQLSDKPKWPMFPVAVQRWEAAKAAMAKA